MPEKIRNSYENNDNMKEFKNNFSLLQKELLTNIDSKGEIININKEFNDLLREAIKQDNLNIDFYIKLAEIEKKLYSPEFANNKIAKNILEVINLINNLDLDISKEKTITQISNILNNPKIPSILKKQLVDFLKKHHLPYIEGIKYVEIINELTMKYPQHNWDNSILVPDPEGGYVYTNNL